MEEEERRAISITGAAIKGASRAPRSLSLWMYLSGTSPLEATSWTVPEGFVPAMDGGAEATEFCCSGGKTEIDTEHFNRFRNEIGFVNCNLEKTLKNYFLDSELIIVLISTLKFLISG